MLSPREKSGSNCSVQFAKHALWCTFCVQSVGTRITFSLRHKILLVRVLYWGCKSNTGFHSESKSIPSRNILKIQYIFIYIRKYGFSSRSIHYCVVFRFPCDYNIKAIVFAFLDIETTRIKRKESVWLLLSSVFAEV